MKKNTLTNLGITLVALLCCTTFSTAQWVPVASPPSDFITDHTVGFSLDGKGYLVTGTDENGNTRDDVYQYDPATDEFTQLEDFPGGNRGFSIGDTWNGKAYVGFGLVNGQTPTDDLWEYDPATDSWTELASCPCEARFHPAFIAHNDKIFVGLGSSGFNDLNDWWIYDMASDTWSEGAGFPSTPRHHPYQFAIDNYIYAGFGHGGPNIYNTWYRYDPANDLWDQMATLPAEGRVAGQQFAWNGKGYILSGEGEDHSAMNDGEFWCYDPVTDSWEELESHPSTSRWAPATFVIDDEAYLFNGIVYGFGPPESMDEAYKFNLNEDVMSSTQNLENEINFSIQPNPATDYLLIERNGVVTESEEYTVLDLSGKELMRFEVANKKELDISGLENGVYILSVKSGTRQFVVSR